MNRYGRTPEGHGHRCGVRCDGCRGRVLLNRSELESINMRSAQLDTVCENTTLVNEPGQRSITTANSSSLRRTNKDGI